MDELLAAITAKKERLDAMRPVSRAAPLALQKSYDAYLTYTSNAIEVNTLTLRETAEVIELGNVEPSPAASFDAHYRLVGIHPFGDGNGRTARLLMNLLLLREGYPPVSVRPEDRKIHLDTLEQASVRDDLEPFRVFMYQRLDATLKSYLAALREV
jgi:Fic family protein